MTKYAFVENGEVTYLGSIPANFRNIGGFDKIQDDAIYKKYGVLPYTHSVPEYIEDEQKLGGYVYDIGEDSIHSTLEVIDLNPEEIAEQKKISIRSLKFHMNQIMYGTDWIYCLDSGLSESQLEAYANVRASILSLKGEELQNLPPKYLRECMKTVSYHSHVFEDRRYDFTVRMTAAAECLTDLILKLSV